MQERLISLTHQCSAMVYITFYFYLSLLETLAEVALKIV